VAKDGRAMSIESLAKWAAERKLEVRKIDLLRVRPAADILGPVL
jgi:hypothetical protein